MIELKIAVEAFCEAVRQTVIYKAVEKAAYCVVEWLAKFV